MIVVPAWDLVALDRASGAERWRFAPADDYPGATGISTANGWIFTAGRKVYAVEAATGAVVWERRLGDRAANPTVSGPSIFVTSRVLVPGTNALGGGAVHALSSLTGEILWSLDLATEAEPHAGAMRAPVPTASLVIVATSDGRVIGIERESGAIRWTYHTSDRRDGGAVVVDDLVVTAGLSGAFRH